MRKALAIGTLCLAALAGCGDKGEANEVKVEYTPTRVKVRKGDTCFEADGLSPAYIRGNLFYTNKHGNLVYISAKKEGNGPFVVDYVKVGDFKVFCNPIMETQDVLELCPAAAEKWRKKCVELDCDAHVTDWLENRPSLAEWYL